MKKTEVKILEIGVDRVLLCVDLKEHLMALYTRKMKRFNYIESIEKGVDVLIIDEYGNDKIVKISDFEGRIEGTGAEVDNYLIKVGMDKSFGNYHLKITLNVPKLFYQTNENNIHQEYLLEKVPGMIETLLEYNGIIFTDNIDEVITVTQVEMNTNIIGSSMAKTKMLIEQAWMNNGNKVFSVNSKEHRKESIFAEVDKRWKLKVYNKSLQLLETEQVPIENDITRFEIVFMAKEINRELKEGKIKEGNGIVSFFKNIEKFKERYVDLVVNYIEKPVESLCDVIVNRMVDELESGDKPTVVLGRAIENYGVFVEGLVDVVLFDRAMEIYYTKHKKANLRRDIRNAKAKKKETNPRIYEELEGNLEVIEEFIESVKANLKTNNKDKKTKKVRKKEKSKINQKNQK